MGTFQEPAIVCWSRVKLIIVIHDDAKYVFFPRLIFSPNRKAKVSAFFGKPTWSPRMKRLFSASLVWFMAMPSSSRTYIW